MNLFHTIWDQVRKELSLQNLDYDHGRSVSGLIC